MITYVNLIVGTTHDDAPINMSVTHAAKSVIHNGKLGRRSNTRGEGAWRPKGPPWRWDS
jgi:hypothetical protein